ncbi:hypothetical protein WCLP8_1020002 [uncultured Gammaproteobacteria bacterium]
MRCQLGRISPPNTPNITCLCLCQYHSCARWCLDHCGLRRCLRSLWAGFGVVAGVPDRLDRALAKTETGDVWGIGRAYASKLAAHGITTALQLREADDGWIKRYLGISALKTVLELRGVACHDPETQPDHRHSCTVSRSFGQPTGRLDDIRDAVVSFAGKAAEKLRAEKLSAGMLTVYAATNRFRNDQPQKTLSASAKFYPPQSDALRIIQAAVSALTKAWDVGPWEYSSAGILLADLVADDAIPRDLFFSAPAETQSGLMQAVDRLNMRFGRGTASFGLVPEDAAWKSRQERKSPDYTSRWSDIPVAEA